MDWLVIDGVKPWDGRYEFDLAGQELTTREWGWIKRLAGYLPLNIDDGFQGADPELFAAFAAIALYRAGKVEQRDVPDLFERLQDAPFGATIRLETDSDAEVEANPSPPSSSGSDSTSGVNGKASSASSDVTPAPIGTPALGSSGSVPTRSAN